MTGYFRTLLGLLSCEDAPEVSDGFGETASGRSVDMIGKILPVYNTDAYVMGLEWE